MENMIGLVFMTPNSYTGLTTEKVIITFEFLKLQYLW